MCRTYFYGFYCHLYDKLPKDFFAKKILPKSVINDFYVYYRPDQDLEILYDYVLQLLSGQIKIKIHVTAVNVDEDVQVRIIIILSCFEYQIILCCMLLFLYYRYFYIRLLT